MGTIETHKDYINSCSSVSKWMGSKLSIRQEIIDEIEKTHYTGIYIEPFVGGGSVLLGLQPKRAIINDRNGQLMNLWRCIRTNVEELIAAYKDIDRDPVEESYFYQMRDEHNTWNAGRMNDSRSAAVFAWVVRHSFNGLYRVRKDGKNNANWNKQEHPAPIDFDNWRNIAKYLRNNDVKILNVDFALVLALAREGDLVYADPPYAVGTGEKAYSKIVYGGFDIKTDSERLASMLATCPAHVLASNNDNDVVRKLYPDDKWSYKELNVRRSFHGSIGDINYKKRAEVLVKKKGCGVEKVG